MRELPAVEAHCEIDHAGSLVPSICPAPSACSSARPRVLLFPVDFQARGRWAVLLWCDPTQWLPSARALDDSSRALRELIGRLVYRTW